MGGRQLGPPGDRACGGALGAVDFLHKPIDSRVIESKVGVFVDNLEAICAGVVSELQQPHQGARIQISAASDLH